MEYCTGRFQRIKEFLSWQSIINPAKVVTGVCRFSYANLWEARAMDENSKPKYSVSLIIPKSDTKTIEKIVPPFRLPTRRVRAS